MKLSEKLMVVVAIGGCLFFIGICLEIAPILIEGISYAPVLVETMFYFFTDPDLPISAKLSIGGFIIFFTFFVFAGIVKVWEVVKK